MRLCGTVWLCVLAAAHSIYAADNISANANAGASPFTADIVVDPTCLWKAERSIASGCGLGDEGRLRAETAALVHACVQFADDPVLRRLRVIAGVARLYPELQRLSTEFSAATGIPTYFNFSNAIGGSISRIRAVVARPPPIVDTVDTSGGVDAIIANPAIMPDVDQAGKLLDLSPLVSGDGQLRWFEMTPALREQMVVYGNKVVGIPVTTSPVFLFYHKPVFARDNLTVPVTWEQVLALAERYNGTDLNGDGVPGYGMCMTPSECFVDGTILTWVLGSYAQTHGASQGLFIDAETMSNLANTSALTAALDVMRRLRRVGPRSGNCAVFEDEAYLEGRCLLSITTPTTFKAAYSPEKPARFAAMRGRMGMAPFPGSTRVLDRASGNLTDCDAARCPMARVYINDTSGVRRPVNQPTPSANVVVLINSQSTVKYQFYAYSHQLAALDAKAVKAWLQDASWKGRANKNNPRFYADVPADDSGPFAAIRKAIIDAINKAERKKRQKVGGTGKTGKTGRIHLKMKGEEEMAYEYEAAYSMDAATGSSPNKHRVAPVAAPTCVLVASVYGGALTPAAAAKAIEAASTVPPQRFSLKAVKVEPTGLKATTKANIGNTFALGIKHTAATKAKMSAAQKGKKGKKRTAATKAKMSAAQKGKKHTAATKAKMSAARKGKKHTAASKAKMSAAQKGKKRTAATKAKMSAAQNRRRLRESRA